MRVVFDTNVVVSSLIFGGRLVLLRVAWASRRLVPVICRETAEELLRVLAYPKFQLSAADRAVLLEDYLPHAEIAVLPEPPPTLPVSCRDRNDVVFLQLARAAVAPLVSGDKDLIALRSTTSIEILSVAEIIAQADRALPRAISAATATPRSSPRSQA